MNTALTAPMLSGELNPLDMESPYTGICKNKQVLVIGKLGVGKTTVIEQMQDINRRLSTQKYDSIKQLICATEFTETCNFYVKGFRDKAINNADVILLVYTVDDAQSFDYLTMLLADIANIKGRALPVIVVANKLDTGLRKIHPVVADCIVTIDFECMHVEASAERGDGLNHLFSCLLEKLGEKPIVLVEEDNKRFRRSLVKRISTVFRNFRL